MNKDDIAYYLQRVGEELASKGEHGKILLLGGAVMLLVVGNRSTTSEASTEQEKQWAALFVASIEQLCIQDELAIPSWIQGQKYRLQEPWYPEARSENMRRYLRETTSPIFAQYNVFGGSDILDRV